MMPLKNKRILSFETWGSGAYHAELLAFLGFPALSAANASPTRPADMAVSSDNMKESFSATF